MSGGEALATLSGLIPIEKAETTFFQDGLYDRDEYFSKNWNYSNANIENFQNYSIIVKSNFSF